MFLKTLCLGMSLLTLIGCMTYRREPSRLSYSTEKIGALLVSTSPSFDRPVIQKKDGSLFIRSGWLIKNTGTKTETLTTGTADLALRNNKKIPAKCFTNNQALYELSLSAGEQAVIHCEVKIPLLAKGNSSDEKAQFNLHLKADFKISNSVFLKAEDFE